MLLNYLRTVLYSDEIVNLIWCEDIFFRGLSKDIPNKFLDYEVDKIVPVDGNLHIYLR